MPHFKAREKSSLLTLLSANVKAAFLLGGHKSTLFKFRKGTRFGGSRDWVGLIEAAWGCALRFEKNSLKID